MRAPSVREGSEQRVSHRTGDKSINHFIAVNLQEVSNVTDRAVDAATDGRPGDVIQAIYDCYEHLGKALILARASMEGVESLDTERLRRLLYVDIETDIATHEPGITGD